MVSSRAPSLIDEEEDDKGANRTRAPSLMEEDRMRRGPGGRGGYDPPAARMMRGPGGRGPTLSSRGQEKEVEEGARWRRAPSLIEEGARRTRRQPGGGGPPNSPRRRKVKRGKFGICRLAQLSVGPQKKKFKLRK